VEVTLRDVLVELREFRAENLAAHEKLNGRVHDAEVAVAVNQADITNLEEKVHSLAIVDKSVAILSGVGAAIVGVIAGSK